MFFLGRILLMALFFLIAVSVPKVTMNDTYSLKIIIDNTSVFYGGEIVLVGQSDKEKKEIKILIEAGSRKNQIFLNIPPDRYYIFAKFKNHFDYERPLFEVRKESKTNLLIKPTPKEFVPFLLNSTSNETLAKLKGKDNFQVGVPQCQFLNVQDAKCILRKVEKPFSFSPKVSFSFSNIDIFSQKVEIEKSLILFCSNVTISINGELKHAQKASFNLNTMEVRILED